MSNIPENERIVCLELLSFFKIEGKSANEVVTQGQLEIFHALVFRDANRLQIICPTQYGKSLIVAIACVVITCIQKKIVAIVAPSNDKAKIIMRYYIEHLGDSPNFYKCLEKDTKLERLRMEENKERIMLNNGGGIFVISAQAHNSQKGIEAAMGTGADIVIGDESSLTPDAIEATVFRMIAGRKDGFYCKIGNPFYRNHFLTSWRDESYKKVFINYETGLQEGRYTNQFIEEAKTKPHFNVLFGCEFPPEDMIDDKGYMSMFSEDEVKNAQKVVIPFGECRLGIDVAESGGDWNVFVLKYPNYASVALKYQGANTMDIVGRAILIATEYGVQDRNIFVDEIGVGKGVVDRFHEQKWRVHGVKNSEEPDDKTQFTNKRAEHYWRLKVALRNGMYLEPHKDWSQLLNIKYKAKDSSGQMMIMPKDEMRKHGWRSPDALDALVMTYARTSVLASPEAREEKELLKQFDFHKQSTTGLTGSRYLRNGRR